MRIKKVKSQGVQKGNKKVKDQSDEILVFDVVSGGQDNIDFNFISFYF